MNRYVYVGFSRPKRWFSPYSWAIRLVGGLTPYSHVFVSWRDPSSNLNLVFEASGTHTRTLSEFFHRKDIVLTSKFAIRVSPEQEKLLARYCLARSGQHYGVWQILGLAVAMLFGLKKNPLGDGQRTQVCVETVCYFLKDIKGLQVPFDPEMGQPKDLHKFLTSCIVRKK